LILKLNNILEGGKINSSTKTVFLLLIFAFNISTLATKWVNKKVTLKGSNLVFKAPNNWQFTQGLYGRDVALLGPETGPKRDVITIELAVSKKFSLDQEKKALESYKQVKNSWIKKRKGSLKNFSLGQKIANLKKDHLFNEVSYSLEGLSYLEGDLFIKCSKDSFINVSFLTLNNKKKAFKKIWLEVLKSLQC
jgi:hypothetical protein